MQEAYLYGDDPNRQPGTEGLNAFFLLVEKPEAYNLPPDPIAPAKHAGESWKSLAFGAAGLIALAIGSAFASTRR
jgi:formate dehydrogenase iron-sulfur subunit